MPATSVLPNPTAIGLGPPDAPHVYCKSLMRTAVFCCLISVATAAPQRPRFLKFDPTLFPSNTERSCHLHKLYVASGPRDTTARQEIDYLKSLVEESAAQALTFRLGGRMSPNDDAMKQRFLQLHPS
jgi:hypothetical protein